MNKVKLKRFLIETVIFSTKNSNFQLFTHNIPNAMGSWPHS